jgi:hypothetical protein
MPSQRFSHTKGALSDSSTRFQERPPHIFDQVEKEHRRGAGGLKAQSSIELRSFRSLRLHHHRPRTDYVRSLNDVLKSVPYQEAADALAGVTPVNGKAADQNDWYWMAGEPFGDPLRSFSALDCSGRQAIEARDQARAGVDRNVNARTAAIVIGPGVNAKPFVQCRRAGFETVRKVKIA